MNETAKISMSAFTGYGQKVQGVTIEIEGADGRLIFRGDMTYEDFAKAVTGHSAQTVKREY